MAFKRIVALMVLLPFSLLTANESQQRFENYDIRVIKPRYFHKANRFDLSLKLSSILDNAFEYTFLLSPSAAYHFSENFAFELGGGYGVSLDRSEKISLKENFDIHPVLSRTKYLAYGALLYTPAYGKTQLANGKLIYFDMHVRLGAGISGVEWNYQDFCSTTNRSNEVVQTPTIVYGFGQNVFTSRENAIVWGIERQSLMREKNDGACDENVDLGGSQWRHQTVINLGYSFYR